MAKPLETDEDLKHKKIHSQTQNTKKLAFVPKLTLVRAGKRVSKLLSRKKMRPRPEPIAVQKRIANLARRVINSPELWMNTPNTQLGDRKPRDLLGTPEETRVLDLLTAIDLGLF